MNDRDLYAQILGIRNPWTVAEVLLDIPEQQVSVFVEVTSDAEFACPECRKPCTRYDTRVRRWRHLDTCQYRTVLVAQVPRVECGEHGVQQFPVPWAEPHSRFTALFEARAINGLREASISAVAELMRLSWAEVDGIMARAVKRGLERREQASPKSIGVDETSFRKRHRSAPVSTHEPYGLRSLITDDGLPAGFTDGLSGRSPAPGVIVRPRRAAGRIPLRLGRILPGAPIGVPLAPLFHLLELLNLLPALPLAFEEALLTLIPGHVPTPAANGS